MIEDTFPARYGLTRTITEVETNEHEIREFIISGKSHYGRGGGSMEDGNYFIDFEGGPFVPLGGDMQNIYPKVEGYIIDVDWEGGGEEGMMSVRVRVDTNNQKPPSTKNFDTLKDTLPPERQEGAEALAQEQLQKLAAIDKKIGMLDHPIENPMIKERREYTEVYMEDIRTLLNDTFDKIKEMDGDTDFHVAERDTLYGKWWDDLEVHFDHPDYRYHM